MAIFSRPKNTKQKVAIFDIGGSSIGVGLVDQELNQKNKLEKSTLTWITRLPLKHATLTDFNSFERENHQTLAKLSDLLWQKNKEPLADIHCFLASPWLATEIDDLGLEDERDILLSDKILSNLTSQNIAKHLNHYSENSGVDFETVDDVVLKTLVNGYETTSSLDNQKAKSLKINHFLSLAEKKTLNNLSNVISGRLYQTKPTFHSNILSNFAVTNHTLNKTDNFIILDVTGELTDVTVSRGGIITHVGSFPFGKNSVARLLAHTINTTPHQAYHLLKSYSEDRLYSSETARLKPIIDSIKKEWQYLLEELLMANQSASSIESLVVIADDPVSILFGKWAEEVPARSFVSQMGDFELYADMCSKSNPPTKDTGLLIAYLFVSNFV